MTQRKSSWIDDTRELATRAVEQEAIENVWSRFDSALETLPEESRVVMRRYFDGERPHEIAASLQVTEAEICTWIENGKQQLIRHLKGPIRVRQ